MRAARILTLSLVLLALHLVSTPTALAGPPAPRYLIKATWGDTNLPPGGQGQFVLQARNVGDATSEIPLTITDLLPPHTTVTGINWSGLAGDYSSWCSGIGTRTATCTVPQGSGSIVPILAPVPGLESGYFSAQPAGYLPTLFIDVSVDSSASGTGINTASITGGGALSGFDIDPVRFDDTPSGFGIVDTSLMADVFNASFPDPKRARQAGDHPFELRVAFDLNSQSRIGVDGTREVRPSETVKTAEVHLPAGLVGDPSATPRCDPTDFAQVGVVIGSTTCPPDTQIGYLNASVVLGGREYGRGGFPLATEMMTRIPLYNLEPPPNRLGDFAANVGELTTIHMYPELDPGRGYSTRVVIPYISSKMVELASIEATLWGVPGDPAHDRFRYFTPQTFAGQVLGAPFGPVAIRPFLTNPMGCGLDNGAFSVSAESYQSPGRTSELHSPDRMEVQGCDDPRVRFDPSLSLRATEARADGPTGLDVRLDIPSRSGSVDDAGELYAGNGFIDGVSTPPLRKAVITLPEGMSVSPAVAQGLGGCSEAQIGLGTSAPASCPESSRVGSLEVGTPILPEPLEGSLYLATPDENPFRAPMAGYLTMEGQGVNIKLPVRLDLSPTDGQVTMTLADIPQLPLLDMALHLHGGPRAALRLPPTCGDHLARYQLTPWSDSRPVEGDVALRVNGGCARGGFSPSLSAGTINPVAGESSPLVLELSREEDEANVSSLSIALPPGLTAKLGSVSRCPPVSVASGGCPQASRIGSVVVAAGSGAAPLWLPQPGKAPTAVYLAGPYKGAPFSLLLAIPAQAGPFDFGTVAVRAAVSIDPRTAAATIQSDPLPPVLEGIPIDYRTIHILLDRPGLIRNPTSCEPARISGVATATVGATAELATRFQAVDCGALQFRPRLAIDLAGARGGNGHPALHAVLRAGAEEAALTSATFTLPAGELLDFRRVRELCAKRLPPDRCPPGSRLGHARLLSPTLDEPLEGPIYLREPTGGFPDLLANLRAGQIHMLLRGSTAAPGGRLQIRLRALPDIPITRATFNLTGGRNGIFVNSNALCALPPRATAMLRAHNGKQRLMRPLVRPPGRC